MTEEQKQIARIEKMEVMLDEILSAEKAASAALDRLEALRGPIKALSKYYSGDEWKRDFQADEDGKLPPGLKRGVLSQDGAYNALEDYRALMARMLQIAAKNIKKGAL